MKHLEHKATKHVPCPEKYQKMKHSRKIDINGRYLTFPGITVVADLETDVSEYLREYSLLVEGTYATLPLESMHMTVKNLWTECSVGGPKKHEETLATYNTRLHELSAALKGTNTVRMRVVRHYTHGVMLKPDSYEDAMMIQHYERLVNSHLKAEVPTVAKHMTLSYRYGTGPDPDLSSIAHLLPEVLDFRIPKVCTFETMERYDDISESGQS